MTLRHRLSTLLFAVAGLSLSTVASSQDMAFLGDSISTGGGAHEALSFDLELLNRMFQDQLSLEPTPAYYQYLQQNWQAIASPAPMPQRLNISRREFSYPISYVADNALLSLSKRYLDTEQYSWGYLLGQKKQLNAQSILIAARDGERSEHAVRQVDRLLDVREHNPPRHLFMFFTGNDLCGPSLEFATEARDYAANQEAALRYYLQNMKADPSQGIRHIWLLDPLSVLQIVSSPEILNRPVKAYGQDLTCRDLQSGRFQVKKSSTAEGEDPSLKMLLNFLFGQGPKGFCPSLFAVHGEKGAEQQMQLAALLGSYRQEMEKMVKRVKDINPLFQIHHVKETSELIFKGDEINNDCFHLNLKGQLKIARLIEELMLKYENPPKS